MLEAKAARAMRGRAFRATPEFVERAIPVRRCAVSGLVEGRHLVALIVPFDSMRGASMRRKFWRAR